MSVQYVSQIQAMQEHLSSIIQQNIQFSNEIDTIRLTNLEQRSDVLPCRSSSATFCRYTNPQQSQYKNVPIQVSDLTLGTRNPTFFSDDSDIELDCGKRQEKKHKSAYFDDSRHAMHLDGSESCVRSNTMNLMQNDAANIELLHLTDAIEIIRATAQQFGDAVGLIKQRLRPRAEVSINPQIALRNFTSECLKELFRGMKSTAQQAEQLLVSTRSNSALKLCKADIARQQLAASQHQGKQLHKTNSALQQQVQIQEFQIQKLVTRLEALTQQQIQRQQSLINKGSQTVESFIRDDTDKEIVVTSEEQLLAQEDAIRILSGALCKIYSVASNKFNVNKPQQTRAEYIRIVKQSKPGLEKALEVIQRQKDNSHVLDNIKHLLLQL